MKNGIITILNKGQARIGYTFRFIDTPATCEGCEYINPCQSNLEYNRVYEVRKILKRRISCRLHENDGVVVSLGEGPYEANLPTKLSLQDALIRFTLQSCDETRCPEFDRCNPIGLREGDRCRIVAIESSPSCPKGLNLSSVKLSRVERP